MTLSETLNYFHREDCPSHYDEACTCDLAAAIVTAEKLEAMAVEWNDWGNPWWNKLCALLEIDPPLTPPQGRKETT